MPQRLVNQFNADERLWKKLATKRRARCKLRPRPSRERSHEPDLGFFPGMEECGLASRPQKRSSIRAFSASVTPPAPLVVWVSRTWATVSGDSLPGDALLRAGLGSFCPPMKAIGFRGKARLTAILTI